MKTRNLDEATYKATMTPKMRDVTDSATGPDVFAYVEAIPPGELAGHEIRGRFVDHVYRSEDERFDHVLVMTKTKNVYLAVIVDLTAGVIHGHHLLDLNRLYGQTP